jgi:hypothetical protein
MAQFSALMNMPTDQPATVAETPAVEPGSAPAAAAAAPEVDPLAEELYADEKLSTPEGIKAAREAIKVARAKAAELTRAAHRAHGTAEKREKDFERAKQQTLAEKHRTGQLSAFQQAAVTDLQSGDPQKFLTAIQRLTGAGDPAGFWRDVSLKLASGGTFTPAEQKQAQKDPEVQAKLAQLERFAASIQEREDNQRIEQLKTQNYEFAKSSDAHPHLQSFATAYPEQAREGIAAVMLEEMQRTGRPIDTRTACGIIEQSLAARYELSPRADGQTNREKVTTSPVLDAGRATSGIEPPKPGTAPSAPVTIPASLSSAPAGASRAQTSDELKAAQIRQLQAMGFYD